MSILQAMHQVTFEAATADAHRLHVVCGCGHVCGRLCGSPLALKQSDKVVATCMTVAAHLHGLVWQWLARRVAHHGDSGLPPVWPLVWEAPRAT